MEPNVGERSKAPSPFGTAHSVEAGALVAKLREIYPEVKTYGLDLDAKFVAQRDAWVITLAKGSETLTTHLERKDAEACLEGIQCVYLGVQIGQFVSNFKEAAHLNA